LQWAVPRELLWAIIFTLAVFVVALWPSHYPYNQAPKVDTQHQSENGVGGSSPAEYGPAPQINPSGKQQREHSSDDTPEIFGIKPGEWLLSIVTLMLWAATVRLVRGADQTAERQLRAYIDTRSATIVDFEPGEQPTVTMEFRNVGQTPAKNVRVKVRVQIRPEDDPPENAEIETGGSRSTIGSKGKFSAHVSMASPLTEDQMEAIELGDAALFVSGIVRYDDIFGNPRLTRFRVKLTADGVLYRNNTFDTCDDGNDAEKLVAFAP